MESNLALFCYMNTYEEEEEVIERAMNHIPLTLSSSAQFMGNLGNQKVITLLDSYLCPLNIEVY